MEAPYYCKSGASKDYQSKCFELVNKAKKYSTGPVIYGYLILKGIGTTQDNIEGNAWLLYAKNKTNQAFASWLYNKNIQNLSPSDISKIEERAKQIANEDG
jgi:hypothetical protein